MKTIKVLVVLLVLIIIIVGIGIQTNVPINPINTETPTPSSLINGRGFVKFEYRYESDEEYKEIIGDMIMITDMFATLRIIPSDNSFNDDEWIYRITFNWNSVLKREDEIMALVGKSSLKFGDVVYVSEEGVDFDSILERVEWKYKDFREYYD